MNTTPTLAASETSTALTVILGHRQLIRVKGFRNYNDITVVTHVGYAIENDERPQDAIQRSREFGHSLLPWTHQAAGVLEADYAGKAEKLGRAKRRREAAQEIEAGQTVQIEGALYTVRIAGENYSDPVHFILSAAK